MDTFIALTVAQWQHQGVMRQMENEQVVRQALAAHRQKTASARSLWKSWHQAAQHVVALILPGLFP